MKKMLDGIYVLKGNMDALFCKLLSRSRIFMYLFRIFSL